MRPEYVWGRPEYAGGAGRVKATKSIQERMAEKIRVDGTTEGL